MENIDHTRAKLKDLETNGICERFHALLDEFYRVAFRRMRYRKELQHDLVPGSLSTTSGDAIKAWWCYGKTPMQTFIDTLPVTKEKLMQAA